MPNRDISPLAELHKRWKLGLEEMPTVSSEEAYSQALNAQERSGSNLSAFRVSGLVHPSEATKAPCEPTSCVSAGLAEGTDQPGGQAADGVETAQQEEREKVARDGEGSG